ncbi:MAG: DUF2235 domain-containing protein [Magnetococcales bacterium]|nr:DUF2235 domain-containing protein [Magnetococcales bacterium]
MKNIVICSDGTSNKGGDGKDTNVFKVYQNVDKNKPEGVDKNNHQVVFYDQGVGTQSNKIIKAISAGVGTGFEKNVMDGYRFLCEHYAPGDKVFLFGFSRGAATVRSLAFMVQMCGIVKYTEHGCDARIDEALERYQAHRPMDAAWCEWVHDMERPIHFLGIWDTVSALGFPEHMTGAMKCLFNGLDWLFDKVWPFKYHRYQANKAVRHVYHALAIDDTRVTFRPMVWREVDQHDGPETVEQVWFAGAHSDVGGGYERTGLSSQALYWMMKWAEHHGLRFEDGAMETAANDVDVNDVLHNPRDGAAMLFRYSARDIEALCHGHGTNTKGRKVEPGKVKVHASVFERMANISSNDYAPSMLPLVVQEVSPDATGLCTVRKPRQLAPRVGWYQIMQQVFAVEEQRRFLFFVFGWMVAFFALVAWAFWINPPMDFRYVPVQQTFGDAILNHLADILGYVVPQYLEPFVRYLILTWWQPLLAIVLGMALARRFLVKKAKKLGKELRQLILHSNPEPELYKPSEDELVKRNIGLRRTQLVLGCIAFVVALGIVWGNVRFMTHVHQDLPPTAVTPCAIGNKGACVTTDAAQYWNRSGFMLEAGARYRVVVQNPETRWVDGGQQATASGWVDWYKNNLKMRFFRGTSRLWARAPGEPLYRLMGAVDASCRKGTRCPTQFPMPLPNQANDSCGAILVAPASGELLTFANDWPDRYANNVQDKGENKGKQYQKFTIQPVGDPKDNPACPK